MLHAAELAAAAAGCLDEWLRYDDLVEVRMVLPAWARQVAGECPRYEFTSQWVGDDRSVVAYRLDAEGPGPWLVITPVETQMRQALGLAPGVEEGSS